MIADILKLIESATNLAREREKNNAEYVERYAQPIFELSQQVFSDYMKLLASLRHRIDSGESRDSLIRFLEQGRVEYLAARIRLRAMLNQEQNEKWSLFERGVFRLLRGGLAHLEDTRPRGYGEHTLLDIMYRIQIPEGEPERPLRYEMLEVAIRFQETTLEQAFKEITLGFEELRASIIPKR